MAFIVIYDACVLFPAPLRDLLIRVARTGVVQAHWSDQIIDECFRAVLRERTDLAPENLARTKELMNISGRGLGVPLDLDPESDEVWDASEGGGDAAWVEYGIEGYCLLRLTRACELANEHRMALVFD